MAAIANELIGASYASSTLLNYQRAWSRFQDTREALGRSLALPATRDEVLLHVAHLKLRGLGAATIRASLSAIGWKHKVEGLPDPTKDYLVSRILTGVSRVKANPPKQVRPISFSLLHKLVDILPSVTQPDFDRTLFKAALLLAYHGAFRAGELTHSGSIKHTLRIENVILFHERELTKVRLTLPTYKHAKDKAVLLLAPSPEPHHCPVQALLAYLRHRPPIPGVLFLTKTGAPLSRNSLALTLKRGISLLGLNPNLYNTHSLRVGRATDLALSGEPDAVIRETGRWASNAFRKYIRFDGFTLPIPPSPR